MNKHGGSKFLSLFLILLFLLSTIDPVLAFADHEQDPALITASVTAPRSQSASISTATSMEKTLVNAGADLFLSLWNLLPSLISLFSSLLSIISGDLGAITDLFTNLATAVVQPLSLLTSYLPPSITKDLLSLTLSIPSLIQEWTGPLTKSIRALSFIQSMLPINIQTALTGIATIIPSLIPAGLSGIFGFSINALTAALGGAAGFAGAAITSILSFSSYLLTIPTTIIGGIAGSLSSFILDIGTTLIGGAASLISAAGTGIISLTSLLGIPAIGTAITTAGSFILSLFLDLAEILGLTGGGGLLGGLTGGISLGAVATALSGGITAVAGQLAPLAGAVVVELVTQAGALITAVGGEIIGALVPLILQIPAALGLATGGTLTVVIEAVAGALVVLGQGIAILGTALVEVAGQLGTAAAALILEAGALGASLVTGVAGAITGAITGAAAGAAAGGLTGFASSLLTSLLTSLGLTVTGGGIGLTGGGLIGAAGSILSFILGSGITSLPVVGTLITYVLNFLGLTLAGGGIGLTGGGLIGAAGSIATKLLSLLMPLAGIGAGGAAGLIPNLMSMVAGILSSILGKFGLDSLAALLQKILTLAGPGISLISETLLSALPSLITDVALEVNDRAMDAIKEIFGLVSGPQGTLLGSPLLLRLLDFNPFTPYIPAITSLLPGELQFRIIIVVNQILDLSIHRFQFIEQFVLRTLVLITSQYTQILGLIFAPILACCTLPLIGLYRLILLPSTILEGSLNGLFAALFDAPLAFGSAISYWSAMLPRIINLPLKVISAPLLFLRGYLSSMFAPPPQNLFMIFLYPLLTIMKVIPAAKDLLPASIIALCSPILVIIFTILSPVLTPLTTLMPYFLNVFRDLDSLAVQILQLLNGIPSLTNSFFVLRLISRCVPLPFTTTIGCLNTLYDLVHRAAALPMSLPCFVPLYQLFNLLIIPNGIINLILSPCYIGIFTVGSIIKGIAEVLTIPELIQIAMLILTLPILLISFILQIPSRIFNNLEMLCVSIIALDVEEPEVGEPLETQEPVLLGSPKPDMTPEPTSTDVGSQDSKDTHADNGGSTGGWWSGIGETLTGVGKALASFFAKIPEELPEAINKELSEIQKNFEGVWHAMVSEELLREYEKGNATARDLLISAFYQNLFYTKGKEGLERYGAIVNITGEKIIKKGAESFIEGVVELIDPATGEVIRKVPFSMLFDIDRYTGELGAGYFAIDLTKELLQIAPGVGMIFFAWEAAPAIVEAVTGHSIVYHAAQEAAKEHADDLKNAYVLLKHGDEGFMRVNVSASALEKDPEVLNALLNIARARGYGGIYIVEESAYRFPGVSTDLYKVNITLYDIEGNKVIRVYDTGQFLPIAAYKFVNDPLYYQAVLKPAQAYYNGDGIIHLSEDDVRKMLPSGIQQVPTSLGVTVEMNYTNDITYLQAMLELEEKGDLTKEQVRTAIDIYSGVEVSEKEYEDTGNKIKDWERGE